MESTSAAHWVLAYAIQAPERFQLVQKSFNVVSRYVTLCTPKSRFIAPHTLPLSHSRSDRGCFRLHFKTLIFIKKLPEFLVLSVALAATECEYENSNRSN